MYAPHRASDTRPLARMLAWVAATNTSKGKVMPSSLAQRVRSRTLRGLLFTAVLAQIGLVPMTAQAQAQPDWVVAINNLRTSAGLPAVVADSASTTGAINHSRYVVLNNLLTHTEVSTMPGYTDSGNTAGQTGDVGAGGGLSSFQDSLKGFMTGGYHWEPIMDPSLVSVGYGTATAAEVQALFPSQFKPGGFGSATTIVFNRSFGKPTKPIMWPPSGGTMPYTSYTGGETPNALTNCAGYSTPTGASLTLQLPSAPQVTGVTLSMAGVSGNLPSCWFDGDNVQFTANESRPDGTRSARPFSRTPTRWSSFPSSRCRMARTAYRSPTPAHRSTGRSRLAHRPWLPRRHVGRARARARPRQPPRCLRRQRRRPRRLARAVWRPARGSTLAINCSRRTAKPG
jgi:uncharacterized protein YkwD